MIFFRLWLTGWRQIVAITDRDPTCSSHLFPIIIGWLFLISLSALSSILLATFGFPLTSSWWHSCWILNHNLEWISWNFGSLARFVFLIKSLDKICWLDEAPDEWPNDLPLRHPLPWCTLSIAVDLAYNLELDYQLNVFWSIFLIEQLGPAFT